MADADWALSTLAAVGSGFAVFVCLSALSFWLLRDRGGAVPAVSAPSSDCIFLFDDEVLVDATPGGRQLLDLAQRGESAWARLMQLLQTRFPRVEERLADLLDRGSIQLDASDGRSRLVAEWRGGLARLQLIDAPTPAEAAVVDRLSLRAMEDELATLRSVSTNVPYLTWTETEAGVINWANSAYLDLTERVQGASGFPSWPPPRIFPASAGRQSGRVSVRLRESGEHWYDLQQIALPGGTLGVATPADGAVAAERSRIEFLQTLTKTFATLSVGLAVFDRSRRLVMFNPALVDLTGLGADLLAQRPSFNAFCERLRDARILPEPKDFASWRQTVTRLISEAERGTFSETWTLAGGRVYEAGGRPMPDGAIAFVLQDVSDGMRLTRQFRADLQLHQAVLTRLAHPLAVFDGEGALFYSNPAYRELWGEAAEAPLPEAFACWSARAEGAAGWILSDPSRGARAQSARLADGRGVEAWVAALPRGASMVSFRLQGQPDALLAPPQGPAAGTSAPNGNLAGDSGTLPGGPEPAGKDGTPLRVREQAAR